jgi:hypothetical protein
VTLIRQQEKRRGRGRLGTLLGLRLSGCVFFLNLGLGVGLAISTKFAIEEMACIQNITFHGQMVILGQADQSWLTSCRFTMNALAFLHAPYVDNKFMQGTIYLAEVQKWNNSW